MEVDFAGKTFKITDPYTLEEQVVTVFVATLPYSQAIYAEGMIRLTEPHWINVNNNALQYFKGVPALVVPDNCKQAVIANRDWVEPELNRAYEEWADWNGTYILPAKVRRPTYKASVENSVGILERGIFHDLEAVPFFSLESFNDALRRKVQEVNDRPFSKKQSSRSGLLEEERKHLRPLPATPYEYAECRTARVDSNSHIQFCNAYYSVPYQYANKSVTVRATATNVRIYSMKGDLLADWSRAEHKGQYRTDPDHMPEWVRDMQGANVVNMIAKASQIGPNTSAFIQKLLESCEVPVQGFRRCHAILRFAAKYGSLIMEESCAEALKVGKINYTFIKTTVAAIAERNDSDTVPERSESSDKNLNESVYAAAPESKKLDQMLARSAQLLVSTKKGDEI